MSRSPSGWTPRSRPRSPRIGDDAWTPIEYTDAVFDEQTQTWVSRAEVAEIGFTAFTSTKQAEQVPGRLVVRRIPDLNPARQERAGHPVRHLAVPRLLHHHRPGRGRHGGRGQDPPWSRDHRAGPRRPEALSARTPALGQVHRERRLARAGRDGVQPDPRRRTLDRPRSGQGHHRDDPPQAHHRPRPGRVLSATGDPAPPTAWPWETAWTDLFTRVCGPPPAPTS